MIDEIFEEQKEREDGRKGSDYEEMRDLILRLLLTSKESNRAVFSTPALLQGLGAINGNYSEGRMNQEELGECLDINVECVKDFYSTTHSTLKSAIATNLNSLMNDENLIIWGKTIMVCKNTPKIRLNELGEYQLDDRGRVISEASLTYRVATVDEKEFILKTEKKILNRMGYKNVNTVISHGKAKEFYDIVDAILKDKCNINYYYKAYEIIFSREMIEKEVEKIDFQQQVEKEMLNARVKDKIIFNAEDRKEKAMTIVSRSKKIQARRSEDFIDNMHKVIGAVMVIPNIIDPSVPIGKDDSENVEVQRFGEPVVPDFEVPYNADILEKIGGLDKESAGRTSGAGFYYLMGDAARLHEAMIAYGRDYMIEKGFTYVIPPFMIRSDVVTGVMSFAEMDAMMYKIEGEDLYLIGTSEHSMIGRFKDQILKDDQLPITLTSYSPCFRKEGGAHGIEERGIYRVHQFEKQEMIVICKPEDSKDWYEKMWRYTVEVFRNMGIPVRQLECCSGDLADLKVKSCDIEAWSPRQKKYFEIGSCSNLGDAQARRLGIKFKTDKGTTLAHTLNNTVVASPRGLIALLENNVNADGSIRIPKVLQPYMGGKELILPIK